MNFFLIIFIGLICASTGQVLWKVGMNQIGQIDTIDIGTIFGMLVNYYVLAGIIMYALSTILWLIALSNKELSYAYPFVSLTYVFVLFFSFFIFKESVTITRVIGTLIIIFGLVFIVRG